MKYEKLSKLFYKMDADSYDKEYKKRTCSYGSYSTSLKIRGFRKGHLTNDSFELFYVNTHELMNLNNEVLLNSSKISSLISQLPKFVVKPYFNKLIINEAQSNNEIEGIRSTKKELKEALKALEQSEPQHKRFVGLMKTYQFIDQIHSFTSVHDFRKLYDELVADEIVAEDAPDGELFRKGYVEVNDGNMTTHIGVSSEQKITEALEALIVYLHDESHPQLYRYMTAHYYYEYIHPFYDGNGRTGRLIVGSYLSRYLEKYSAITFSYAVNKNKEKYYKALEEIPSPLNRGEMTFYLMNMLELLLSGQKGIIEDLELNLMKLKRINNYINSDQWGDDKEERELFRIIITFNVFVNEHETLSVQELMKISDKSRHIVNKVMDYLEQKGFVEMVSRRPKSYKISEECLEEILPS
ncbi:cell filamentation protein Fic [Bacillus nakamurai]|uniref:Cell filamentation protein Fic n=1 Tax=Bacillus nakamurai TaxID=1793963 RepID=A0A150F2J3_9BACI|nr:Fic family protein [Bacillus nakamurai]KXZ13146.1 cell filamentation protein Fic [Bacillus nakamurai]KXZ23252.1 cell filamentation protein Fic [Bacillus nakamurai]MCP6680677.1 Fic family protein [Bacillus nakamurai]MED1227829.1 Fic family protein [Bacillus nakamurai]